MQDELTVLLRRFLGRRDKAQPCGLPSSAGQGAAPVVQAPASAFEAVLQERLLALERELAEVRSRVNGLLFLVVGAVLAQLLLRLLS